jgi:hypothetical protein
MLRAIKVKEIGTKEVFMLVEKSDSLPLRRCTWTEGGTN